MVYEEIEKVGFFFLLKIQNGRNVQLNHLEPRNQRGKKLVNLDSWWSKFRLSSIS